MIITSIHVQNFRSIKDESLECETLTALVGANGAGKSTFLHALELFYGENPKVLEDDFYAGDLSQEIAITVTFAELSDEAKTLFGKYLQNGTLTVERVFSWDGERSSSSLHGATLQHPGFDPVRSALEVKDRGKTAKSTLELLRAQPTYSGLPEWSTIAGVHEALAEWETGHPELCVRQRDDGHFFGFRSVAEGYLGRFTRLLYIPAVRDAADDAEDGRGSVITALVDLLVRSAVAERPGLIRLKARSQALYERALDPVRIPELQQLGVRLTNTLTSLVPDVSVELEWLDLPELEIPMPAANVTIVEDGFGSRVERTGHGLQRAFIITVLQHLAMVQVETVENQKGEVSDEAHGVALPTPSLVLAIEEPELYQHPSRQRHFARTLTRIASGALRGVADRTQVIFGTHSPLFVSIDAIQQVRLLRRVSSGSTNPKITRVVRTTLDAVAQEVWVADGRPNPPYTAATLLPRLTTIMTPVMSEGFFSRVVVLVEGEDDRTALLGAALQKGYDLESVGIAVIACNGKTCIDRPLAIFRALRLPIYAVWDSDKGTRDARPEDNHRLLRLLGSAVEDWPAVITPTFACFETNLEDTLRKELGEPLYDRLLAEQQALKNVPKKKHAQKIPMIVANILEEAAKAGVVSPSLDAIVAHIWSLRAN